MINKKEVSKRKVNIIVALIILGLIFVGCTLTVSLSSKPQNAQFQPNEMNKIDVKNVEQIKNIKFEKLVGAFNDVGYVVETKKRTVLVYKTNATFEKTKNESLLVYTIDKNNGDIKGTIYINEKEYERYARTYRAVYGEPMMIRTDN